MAGAWVSAARVSASIRHMAVSVAASAVSSTRRYQSAVSEAAVLEGWLSMKEGRGAYERPALLVGGWRKTRASAGLETGGAHHKGACLPTSVVENRAPLILLHCLWCH
jgi:hypothetical protein